MILDLVTLAHEALLVFLAHVRIELIVSEETLATEFAERMYATLDLLGFVLTPVATSHRRNVDRQYIRVVQGVLMGENFLEPYA